MRIGFIAIGWLLYSASAAAQMAPCAPQALEYDPYKPSHLAIVREYGGTVMSQVPLSTLLKLDPYSPSQLELLRQVGRGIPAWTAYSWPFIAPAPVVANCVPAPAPAPPPAAMAAPPLTRLADVLTTLDRQPAKAGTAVTLLAPTASSKNLGVSIRYGDRLWTSAGPAVPFREENFVRAGESAGVPIFRRTTAADDVIYVPTTRGMVAPFRAAP